MERRHLASVVVSDCIQFKSGRLVYIGFYIWGNLQSPNPGCWSGRGLGAGRTQAQIFWDIGMLRVTVRTLLLFYLVAHFIIIPVHFASGKWERICLFLSSLHQILCALQIKIVPVHITHKYTFLLHKGWFRCNLKQVTARWMQRKYKTYLLWWIRVQRWTNRLDNFSMELPEIPQPFSVIHPCVLHTRPVELIATAQWS